MLTENHDTNEKEVSENINDFISPPPRNESEYTKN